MTDSPSDLLREFIATLQRQTPKEREQNMELLRAHIAANAPIDLAEARELRKVAQLLWPDGFKRFLEERPFMRRLLSLSRQEFDLAIREECGFDPQAIPPWYLLVIRLHSGGDLFPLGREVTAHVTDWIYAVPD